MAEYRRTSMKIDNGPGIQAQPNSTSQYGQCTCDDPHGMRVLRSWSGFQVMTSHSEDLRGTDRH